MFSRPACGRVPWTPRTDIQFSIFLVNKPGVLAQVTGALGEAKLNIHAMTLVDSQEHGVLRVVADDPLPPARSSRD